MDFYLDNADWWSDLGADAMRQYYFGEIKKAVKEVAGFVGPLVSIAVDYLCLDVGPYLKAGNYIEVSQAETSLVNWRRTMPLNCCSSPWVKTKNACIDEPPLHCCGVCDRRDTVLWSSLKIEPGLLKIEPNLFLFMPFDDISLGGISEFDVWSEAPRLPVNAETRHRFAAPHTHLGRAPWVRYSRSHNRPWTRFS